MIFERNGYMFKDMIDKNTFKAIVGYYGADYCDGSLNQYVLDRMIDEHVSRKEHIFKLFGNKLRVEKEVNMALSYAEGYGIKEIFKNELLENKKFIFAASFINYISVDEFLANTLEREIQIFNITLSKGMKVSKALMRLVLPEDQHEISTKHSMINQSLFTKGKVVLSIDPCDYVTMSSNSSGWKSCHRLNGGEYRTGPIAYLNDSSSVICYVESSTPCKFWYGNKQYEHTNKTWRQIALVNPDATFAIQERQYPNSSLTNQNAVSQLFRECFERLNGKKYKIEEAEVETLQRLHLDYAEEERSPSLYYNDIVNEMFTSGSVIKENGISLQELEELPLPIKGQEVFCLECGETLADSESLYCDDCYSAEEEDEDW